MSLETLLEKGVNLYKAGEFEHAEKALLDAHKIDPKNLDVLNFLGLTNIHQNEFEKALSYFDNALSVDEKDSIVWNNKGDALALQEKHNEALECFNKAIEIDNEYGNAHFNIGLVYADLGDFEKSHEAFSNAIKYNEDDEKIDAYYEQSFVYIEEENFTAALENIEKAEKIKETAELTNLKATCFDHLERYDEALKLFESVEDKAEDDELLADILYNKAFTLISLKQREKAADSLIKAHELLPEIKEDIQENEILMELVDILDFNAIFGN